MPKVSGAIRITGIEKAKVCDLVSLIIEFHKKETPMGPPVEIRISQDELEGFGKDNQLKIIDKFDLGDNFYGYVFEYSLE